MPGTVWWIRKGRKKKNHKITQIGIESVRTRSHIFVRFRLLGVASLEKLTGRICELVHKIFKFASINRKIYRETIAYNCSSVPEINLKNLV